jgi:hypothetical protein
MADEPKKPASIQVVRSLSYDPKSGIPSWSFGTLVFDEDRKFQEFRTGNTVHGIEIAAKPAASPLWVAHPCKPDKPKPDA